MRLPQTFCWSKFGDESGEPVSRIIERKESERRLNDGVFLWGVGNSLTPSLHQLLARHAEPEVLFTPMLSSAKNCDRSPSSIVLWRDAVGIDGLPYEIPRHSIVTSREKPLSRPTHYALVCRAAQPLTENASTTYFDNHNVRNLRTGARVGSSQVTAVVSSTLAVPAQGRYQVRFRAFLTYPFFVTLKDPVQVPDGLRAGLSDSPTNAEMWRDWEPLKSQRVRAAAGA